MTMPDNLPVPDNQQPVPDIDPLNVRNLQQGGLGPLRRFNAVLTEIPWERRTSRNTGRGYIVNKLLFTDMAVEESVEPYVLPTYNLEIPYNQNTGSKWGVFGKSLANVLDKSLSQEQLDKNNPAFVPQAKRPNVKDTYGKRYWLVLADGIDGRPEPPMLYNGGTKKEEPTPSWMVYKVEGFGEINLGSNGANPAAPAIITPEPPAPEPPTPQPATNALQEAMKILDGKDAATFNGAALADETIKADDQVVTAISQGSFLDTMVKSGMFTVDDKKVYHRVQS